MSIASHGMRPAQSFGKLQKNNPLFRSLETQPPIPYTATMDPESDAPVPKALIPALLVSLVLFAGVYIAYQAARARPGTIVLPGGITYLGQTPTPQPSQAPQLGTGKIPIDSNTKWVENKGKKYPYTFSYPSSLSLGFYPNDPYDSVTVFYPNTDSNTNIFFRVDDLNKINKTMYIGKPMEYAQNWWKDYSWKGVSTVTAFTNSKGMNGYRATYTDLSGNTPYDHVFFAVPERTDLIIWVSGKIFSPEIFDKIVDSVMWKQASQ